MRSNPDPELGFSLLVPSWNNLPYLKLLCHSLEKNSRFPHQCIVHANEGSDGTLDFLKNKGICFSHSTENVGVCRALNLASKLAEKPYLVFFNDDMYALPGWDEGFARAIKAKKNDLFFFSGTMLEPKFSGNKAAVAPLAFGNHPEDFAEEALLNQFRHFRRSDWSGATWPPNLVSKRLWDLVGGYSEEFSPGLYSDPDFSMKLWKAGVRDFRGLGESMVYHFMSRSVQRLPMNPGKKTFAAKWGIMPGYFRNHYLNMGKPYAGSLPHTHWSRNWQGWFSKARAWWFGKI